LAAGAPPGTRPRAFSCSAPRLPALAPADPAARCAAAGDQHLKYLAWAQSDRAPVVRAAAVSALVRLYDVEANLLQMKEFTGRWAPAACGAPALL
jgi:hypothetical protein